MKYSIYLAAAALIALAGCGDDGSRRTTGDAGRDAGPIMLLDGGPDSGVGGTDAGGGTDSGGARECEQMLLPYPAMEGPRCSMETKTCLEACTDGACVNSCVMADTTPALDAGGGFMINCGACLGLQQFYCLDSRGSHAQVAAYLCCAEDRGCMDPSCAMSMCNAEYMALGSSPAASMCLTVPTMGDYAVCFP